MKEIQLTKEKIALVDDEDYERVNQYYWQAIYHKKSKRWSAQGRVDKKPIYMHRFIMGVSDPKLEVDHIFHNTLDNRRENLRICTKRQNQANARKRTSRNGRFKGVSLHSQSNKWRVRLTTPESKRISLGCYNSELLAAWVYNQSAIKYHGEYGYLNQLTEEDMVSILIEKATEIGRKQLGMPQDLINDGKQN